VLAAALVGCATGTADPAEGEGLRDTTTRGADVNAAAATEVPTSLDSTSNDRHPVGESSPTPWAPTPAAPVDLCDWLYDDGAIAAVRACCSVSNGVRRASVLQRLDAAKSFCAETVGLGVASGRLAPGAPAARAACQQGLTGMRATACGAYRPEDADVTAWAQASAACRDAYVGTVDLGQACGHPDECKPGLACRGYTVEEGTGKMLHLGICRAPAAVGAACGAGTYLKGPVPHRTVLATRFGDRSACAPGAFCDAEGTCRARSALGASCTDSGECIEGASCRAGACVAGISGAAPDGGACSTWRECGPMSTCSLGACVPRLAAGSVCLGATDCAGTCESASLSTSRCVASCGSR
jgi:hypothetical protein